MRLGIRFRQALRRCRRRGPYLIGSTLLLVLLFGHFVGVFAGPPRDLGEALVPIAQIAFPQLDEPSGLVQSARNPQWLWTHNDSGDRPRLFAIDLKGNVIVPEARETHFPGISVEDARLVDWEDMARCRDRLYISDMGNNLNLRTDLGVYELFEPDAGVDQSTKALRFLPVAYPDQTVGATLSRWDFDCEAMFCFNEKLYFVTKERPAFRLYVPKASAHLYRLDSDSTDSVNSLALVDAAADLGGWVTAADTSSDGSLLAVLTQSPVQSVWLYDRPLKGDRFFSDSVRVRRFVFHEAGQVEALAFYLENGSEDIVLLNEERQLFRIPISKFKEVEKT